MTYTSTVTSKGTITLPAEFRRKLRLTPGRKVTIDIVDGKAIITAPMSLEELRARNQALLKGVAITDKMINDIMAEAAIERYQRSLG